MIFVLKSLAAPEGGTPGRYRLANRVDSGPPVGSGWPPARGGKNYRLTLLNEQGSPGIFLSAC